jgi:ADP-ribose pyrophosphatase YjhB (NUDIX family)
VSELDGWRFCPRCGGALEIEKGFARCEACGEHYWANAIPGVQGLLEREGRVLLARRANAPRRGYWDLPGGFLEETEDPLDGLRREFLEETGLRIDPIRFLGIEIEPYDGRYVLSITWLVAGDGQPRPADDVAELAFFGPSEVPAVMAFPGQDRVLAGWAATARKG